MNQIAFARPKSIADTCSLLEEYGDTTAILAGGQSLLPMLRQGVSDYEYVIDINELDGQDYIRADDDHVEIGCLARHVDVMESPAVADNCRILAEATGGIGDVQIRNRGTVCGSIAHADPAGDPPVVAEALNAEIVVQNVDGTRTIDSRSFFEGFYETALEPRDLVTAVRFPVVEPPRGAAYEKYEPSEGAYPVATVAAVVECEDDRVTEATLVTGALDIAPTRMPEAAAALEGEEPTEETVERAAELVGEHADPLDDVEGSQEFKRAIVRTLAYRAIETAVGRARGS